MSLLGPRHSCLSGLAISNRSEPEAQGVVGSVVFLVTTLDDPRLRRVAPTQTWILFPPSVLPGSAVWEKYACTTLRSRRGPTGYLPLEVRVAALVVARGTAAQEKRALLKQFRPGTSSHAQGLQAEQGSSPKVFCRELHCGIFMQFLLPLVCAPQPLCHLIPEVRWTPRAPAA